MWRPTTRWLLCALAIAGSKLPANEITAGFSRTDITPPTGYRIAGNYFESLSQGVDDPLHGRVMYLADDNTQVIIISLDVCSIGRTASDPIRAAIHQRTSVPSERIIISATHNHAGPEYYGTLRDHLHEQALKTHNGRDPAEPIDYVKLLCERLSDATARAIASAVAVQFSVGETKVADLPFNRRFHMQDGSVRMNPGFQNPDIVRVAGPIDPRLPVLLAHRADNQAPLGLYTTFAMHTATYGDLTRFGADFPGILDLELQRDFGSDFVTLFGEGTAGDINHFDVSQPAPPNKWTEHARIGKRLADSIRSLLPEMSDLEATDLRFARTIVPVPLADVDAAFLNSATEVLFAPLNQAGFLQRVHAWQQMNTNRLIQRDGPNLKVEVQAVRLGSQFGMVFLPHEVFVELGMMIRDASPFPITAVVTLAQDLDFYVPTEKAFREGSYEVTTSSIKSGGGERIAVAAGELLKTLVID